MNFMKKAVVYALLLTYVLSSGTSSMNIFADSTNISYDRLPASKWYDPVVQEILNTKDYAHGEVEAHLAMCDLYYYMYKLAKEKPNFTAEDYKNYIIENDPKNIFLDKSRFESLTQFKETWPIVENAIKKYDKKYPDKMIEGLKLLSKHYGVPLGVPTAKGNSGAKVGTSKSPAPANTPNVTNKNKFTGDTGSDVAGPKQLDTKPSTILGDVSGGNKNQNVSPQNISKNLSDKLKEMVAQSSKKDESKKNSAFTQKTLNGIQLGLDLVGLVPVVGEMANGVNAIIYLTRDDFENFALSGASMIPFAGWVSTGGKLVRKAFKGLRKTEEGVEILVEGATKSINVKPEVADIVAKPKTAVDDAFAKLPSGAVLNPANASMNPLAKLSEMSFGKMPEPSAAKSPYDLLREKNIPTTLTNEEIALTDKLDLKMMLKRDADKVAVKSGSDVAKTTARLDVDDLIGSSKPIRTTKGNTPLYSRTGGYSEALKDFTNLGLKDVMDIPNGKMGKLPDGRIVNVRTTSTDGRPTLEIYDGKNSIKFRYDD